MATRPAAEILRASAARGLKVCVVSFEGESLAAYSPPPFQEVHGVAELSRCDVALSFGRTLPAQERAALAYRTVLPALTPIDVYSRHPLSAVLRTVVEFKH